MRSPKLSKFSFFHKRNRSILVSPSIAKKQRRSSVFRSVLFSVFSVVVLTGVSFFSSSPFVSIKNISISGTKVVSPDDLKKETEKMLAGSYFGLFSKNNILLYPKVEIEKSVMSGFGRIKDVNVSVDGKNGLKMEVLEYKPDSLWCGGGGEETFSNDCYFIDETGYLFAKAPQFSGNVFFKYYGLLSEENPVGQNYLSENPSYGEISKFVKFAEELKISPIRLYVNAQKDFFLYLESGIRIIFSDSNLDIARISENLSVLIESGEITDKRGNFISGLDYVDLRFGNKVYYKMK